jgi:cation diffusion facilitator family transporter
MTRVAIQRDQMKEVSQRTDPTAQQAEHSIAGGKQLAFLSLFLNLLLSAAKYLLYRFGGSTAVLAEAVHSLTDVVGSLLVIAGIFLAEKRSKRFPWGLYKVENLAAALSSILIFVSAYEIAVMIYRPSPAGLTNLDSTLFALLAMAIPVFFFSRYEAKRAAAINSPSLMADAENWRTDLAPLAVVAAGVVGARFSLAVADRIAASLVLILVVRAGFGILKDSLKSLLDASVDAGTLERMREVVRSVPQIKEPFSLQARNSGRFIFVELSVRVAMTKLKEAHTIVRSLEQKIKERIPFVERVVVHYEPERKELLRYAALLADKEGAISEHFGKAPWIAVWDRQVADGSTVCREILKNPFSGVEKGKGIKLAEYLVTLNIDVLYTREPFEGKGPAFVLADADVDVRQADARDLGDIMTGEGDKAAA